MTIAAGYPDWQHIDTKVGAALYSNTALNATAGATIGPFFVGNYPAVNLFLVPSGTSGYTVSVDWASDSTFATVLVSRTFVIIGGGGNLRISLGVAAPWVRIVITAGAVVAGDTINAVVTPTTVALTPRQFTNGQLVTSFNEAIGAGSTSTHGPTIVAPGPAVLVIATSAINSTVSLARVNANGTAFSFLNFAIGSAGLQQSFQVVLPNNPVQLQITNNDTVTHLYTVQLGSTETQAG
jgi:hypothetical protein